MVDVTPKNSVKLSRLSPWFRENLAQETTHPETTHYIYDIEVVSLLDIGARECDAMRENLLERPSTHKHTGHPSTPSTVLILYHVYYVSGRQLVAVTETADKSSSS